MLILVFIFMEFVGESISSAMHIHNPFHFDLSVMHA